MKILLVLLEMIDNFNKFAINDHSLVNFSSSFAHGGSKVNYKYPLAPTFPHLIELRRKRYLLSSSDSHILLISIWRRASSAKLSSNKTSMWSFLLIPIKKPIFGRYFFKKTSISLIISTALERPILIKLWSCFEGRNSPAILPAYWIIRVLNYDSWKRSKVSLY